MTGSPVADQAIRERYVNPSGDADFDQVIVDALTPSDLIADLPG